MVLFKVFTQQTENICLTFIQCRTNVEDVGPTLHKCHTNVLCLLGISKYFLMLHRVVNFEKMLHGLYACDNVD